MRHNAILTLTQIESRIESALYMAKLCHMTSSAMREHVNKEVFKELLSRTDAGKARYPQSVRSHATGYLSACDRRIWREDVEFCYRDTDGTIYSTHKGSTHRSTEEWYASGRGAELGNLDNAHVWKGTDKPFTEWQTIGERNAYRETVKAEAMARREAA